MRGGSCEQVGGLAGLLAGVFACWRACLLACLLSFLLGGGMSPTAGIEFLE